MKRLTSRGRARALSALLLLAGLAMAAGPSRAGVLEEIHQADGLAAAGDFTGAVGIYNRVIRSDQLSQIKLSGTLLKRAQLYRRIGERDLALADMDRAVTLNPSNTYFRLAYGGALLAERRYDQALEQYQAAAELEPQSRFPLSAMGVLWWEQGDLERAERYLKRAAAKQPPMAWDHDKLGTFYLSLGRYDQARRQFQQAVKLAPDSAELPLMLFMAEALADGARPSGLERAAGKLAGPGWPAPAFQLYLGRLSPEKYLAWLEGLEPAAREKREGTARYFLAYYYLLKGEQPPAVEQFDWLLTHSGPEHLAHSAARAELRRRDLLGPGQ